VCVCVCVLSLRSKSLFAREQELDMKLVVVVEARSCRLLTLCGMASVSSFKDASTSVSSVKRLMQEVKFQQSLAKAFFSSVDVLAPYFFCFLL
jgi:hypothetical protein